MVQRTLKWIAHSRDIFYENLTKEQLCEAVSVNLGDQARDPEAVPDALDILRSCRSLIRLSADEKSFEFAHFTVLEFLKSLGNENKEDLTSFHVFSNHVHTELFKTCVTYLNFSDFSKGGDGSKQLTTDRFRQYPFRSRAINFGYFSHEKIDWNNESYFSLVTNLFNPSKPSNLISWAQDFIIARLYIHRFSEKENSQSLSLMNRGISNTTALHFASMFNMERVCRWLIHNGCDVNRRSTFGTPLHFAQLSARIFDRWLLDLSELKTYDFSLPISCQEAIGALLELGADPDDRYISPAFEQYPLKIAILQEDHVTVKRLLEHHAIVDYQFLSFVDGLKRNKIRQFLDCISEHVESIRWGREARGKALQLAIRTGEAPSVHFFPTKHHLDKGEDYLSCSNQDSLLSAATYGQMEVVLRLLNDHDIDPNAAEGPEGDTALCKACDNDHADVAKTLVKHGANPLKADHFGRNAMHYSSKSKGSRCLSYFMSLGLDTTITDKNGITPWQLAALAGNSNALQILVSDKPLASSVKTQVTANGQRSLVSCAAERGFPKAVSLLLDAGFSGFEVDENGKTALHFGVEGGSLDVVRRLIAQGLGINATAFDGSSAIHFVGKSRSTSLKEMLTVLVGLGANPYAFDNSGNTLIMFLIEGSSKYSTKRSETSRKEALITLAHLPQPLAHKQEATSNSIHRTLVSLESRDLKKRKWQLKCLLILLDADVDLAQQSLEGLNFLETLLRAWEDDVFTMNNGNGPDERDYSYKEYNLRCDVNAAMDQVILTALKRVPAKGPLHETCARPEHLLYAIETAGDAVVEGFLEHVTEVHKWSDERGDYPILAACQKGRSRAIIRSLLVRSRALKDQDLARRLVHEACKYEGAGHCGALLELLGAGLDPKSLSNKGQSALMFAAQAGNVAVVKELISRGCDTNIRDHANRSIAHYACAAGNLHIVRVLEDKPVDWNAEAEMALGDDLVQGVTILHLAAILEDASLLTFLLDKGLCEDFNCTTSLQETPLYLASLYGLSRNIDLLLSKNADPMVFVVQKRKYPSHSPIHKAAVNGDIEVMYQFMKHDCDLQIPDDRGLNNEMLALKNGHTELAGLIGNHVQKHRTFYHRGSYQVDKIENFVNLLYNFISRFNPS